MYKYGSNRSAIRDLFEYGKKRKQEIGAENVYDFSLGNPSIPAPKIVDDTIDVCQCFEKLVHKYLQR